MKIFHVKSQTPLETEPVSELKNLLTRGKLNVHLAIVILFAEQGDEESTNSRWMIFLCPVLLEDNK